MLTLQTKQLNLPGTLAGLVFEVLNHSILQFIMYLFLFSRISFDCRNLSLEQNPMKPHISFLFLLPSSTNKQRAIQEHSIFIQR